MRIEQEQQEMRTRGRENESQKNKWSCKLSLIFFLLQESTESLHFCSCQTGYQPLFPIAVTREPFKGCTDLDECKTFQNDCGRGKNLLYVLFLLFLSFLFLPFRSGSFLASGFSLFLSLFSMSKSCFLIFFQDNV